MSTNTTMTDLAVQPPPAKPDHKPEKPHPSPGKKNQNNKRPRFNQNRSDNKASYQQAQIPASLSMTPRLTHLRIYTSSNQIPLIATCVFNSLCARIKMLNQVVTLPMFKYVVSITWYARLVEVSRFYGTCFPPMSSDLVQVGRAIQLPSIVCKYIETLGQVTMANGASTVPYCASYRELIPIGSEWYYDPLEAIQEGMRPDPHTEWSLDEDWVRDYVQATSRILRNGVEMRTLTREFSGSLELLVGYQHEDLKLRPQSCERLSTAVGELGAAYGLRDYGTQADWPFGDNYAIPPLFEGASINPELTISDLISGTYIPRSV